jgi:hypothetical protein
MIRAIFFLFLLAIPAQAGAPPGTYDPDGSIKQWFERQQSVEGFTCCSIADGHILGGDQWRINMITSRYEVLIEGDWITIEPKQMRRLEGGMNPTEGAVVWYIRAGTTLRIYCFAPGQLY